MAGGGWGGGGCSTCLELGAICEEVGLPAGVLNVITVLGQHAGAPLSSHPDLDKVISHLSLSIPHVRADHACVCIHHVPADASTCVCGAGGVHWEHPHGPVCDAGGRRESDG